MPRILEKKQTPKGRRGNNEGSIYQRSDGRWCAQVVTGYKDDGAPKRKYVYAQSRAEVARKAAELANHVFETGYVNGDMRPDLVTVDELSTNWLMDYKRFSVSSRTFEWYLNLTKMYIKPTLGNQKVADVQPLHVQRVLNRLLDNGKAVSTVKSAQFVARQLFAHAVEMNLISENPAAKTKIQRHDRKAREDEMKAIPIEYRSRILEAAETQSNIKPIITTLMFSGLRSGEMIALKWKNINFDAMTISVDGAVTVDSQYDRDGICLRKDSVLSSTKTVSGFRTIRVSARVMDVLKQWRQELAIQEITDKRELIGPDCFVFPTRTGEMRAYAGFRSLIRRFLESNGFQHLGIHPHSFRHTFANILLENNVNPRVVQLYLGHHDVQTTLNTYSSVASEVFDKTAQRIDSVYDEIVNGTYTPLSPTVRM